MTKKFKYLIIVFALLSATTVLSSDPWTPPPSGGGSTDIPPVNNENGGKRRSIAANTIYCQYGPDWIILELPEGMNWVLFQLIKDNDLIYEGFYNRQSGKTSVPKMEGRINIRITADNGCIYEGYLIFPQ